MPELYGICSDAASPESLRQAADRMRRSVETLRPGTPSDRNGPGFALGTLSRHSLDAARIDWDESCQAGWAWIGTPPDPALIPGPARLVDDLAAGRLEALWRHEPRFAACVVDAANRTAWLLSDRYGHTPLHYACEGGTLAFATRLGALLDGSSVPWQPDPAGLIDMLAFGHLTGTRTLARGVSLLPPASVLRFADGRAAITSYQQAPRDDEGPARRTDAALAERLYHGLQAAVRHALPPDRRVAITLSGGMDSRALLQVAQAEGADATAFTFGLEGSPDLEIAARVAKACGIPHTGRIITPAFLPRWLDTAVGVTGGMVSCDHFHILALADDLAATGRRVLDGLSGDAILGATLSIKMYAARSREQAIALTGRRRGVGWFAAADLAAIATPALLAAAGGYEPRSAVARSFEGVPDGAAWRGCFAFDMDQRQRRVIQYGPQLEQLVADVKTPFYANPFRDLADTLGRRHLVERRLYLKLYRRHLAALASISDSGRNIPLSWPFAARMAKKAVDGYGRRLGLVRSRPGIIDYPRWFREDLAPFVSERILDAPPALWDVLRRDAVERLLADHRTGAANHAGRIAILLSLAAWYARTAA